MNRLLLSVNNGIQTIGSYRLTNLQRVQAIFTVSIFGWVMLTPVHVWAGNFPAGPLGNGAGQQAAGGQCGQSFWFMANLYSFIASSFQGFGDLGGNICQIINIVFIFSLLILVVMILWAVGDHHLNDTPYSKAFKPFTGWITGLVVVYTVILISFLNFGANNAQPGVAAP